MHNMVNNNAKCPSYNVKEGTLGRVILCNDNTLYTVKVKDGKLKEKWVPGAIAQTVPFHVLLNAGGITFQSQEWILVLMMMKLMMMKLMINTNTCSLCVVSFFIYILYNMAHAYNL